IGHQDYGSPETWPDQMDKPNIAESTPDPEPQPEADQTASVSYTYSYHISPTLLRKAIWRNCLQVFDSHNKLHKHTPNCRHKRSISRSCDGRTSVVIPLSLF